MTAQSVRLRIVAGIVLGSVVMLLAAMTGDAVAGLAYGDNDFSFLPPLKVCTLTAFHLFAFLGGPAAVLVTLGNERVPPWGWIAGSLAVALFLVPVWLILTGWGVHTRVFFGVWAVAFAELAVAWAVALAGRWGFMTIARRRGDAGSG